MMNQFGYHYDATIERSRSHQNMLISHERKKQHNHLFKEQTTIYLTNKHNKSNWKTHHSKQGNRQVKLVNSKHVVNPQTLVNLIMVLTHSTRSHYC